MENKDDDDDDEANKKCYHVSPKAVIFTLVQICTVTNLKLYPNTKHCTSYFTTNKHKLVFIMMLLLGYYSTAVSSTVLTAIYRYINPYELISEACEL
jgi:hypothetical protein